MMKVKTLVPILISISLIGYSQSQIGQDIDGESAGDLSGLSVSMPNPNTLAIGAPYNNGVNGSAGHVRVYSNIGSTWIQKGSDIDGVAAGDYFGCSIGMPDSNTIAVGAINNGNNGIKAGHVRIYSWTGTLWMQKGLGIDGEASYDHSGRSISMADANTIAIGASSNNSDTGHVRIYKWNGSSWIQKGADIDGESLGDHFGWSVSMPDSNTVAIGGPNNSDNGVDAGHVRVFNWNGTAWIKKGQDIDGEAAGDLSGASLSMPDINTIAIGAPWNSGNGLGSGHARVYSWNGTNWTQKGADIDGEAAGDTSGWSVNMPDANTIAIGAPWNSGNGTKAGSVRVYKWNGTTWSQKCLDIDGEASGDFSGISLSMADSNIIAIGASENNGNGVYAGHVRVYNTSVVSGINNNSTNTEALVAYPNPTDGIFVVSMREANLSISTAVLTNMVGETLVKMRPVADSFQLNVSEYSQGVYFMRIEFTNGSSKVLSFVKR